MNMRERSKRYGKAVAAMGDKAETPVVLEEAVKLLKQMVTAAPAKFDQSIEIVMNLGIDPKQADQMIRGSVSLPNGIGKSRKVIAFAEGEQADKAKAAGAIEVGADELIQKVMGGWTDFDVAVAHPSLMGRVGRLGRVLGPQGKMPSPKSGTVTADVETAVREYAAGKVEFRNDAGGNVHAVVGKSSFAEDVLKANIEAFIEFIRRMRPAASKGTFIKKVCVKATMTPAVEVIMVVAAAA
jgi:large subunit ribosomal protein L1